MPVQSLKDVRTLEVHCNWDANIAGKNIIDTVLLSQDEADNKESENLR